jgi:hypothetical protein
MVLKLRQNFRVRVLQKNVLENKKIKVKIKVYFFAEGKTPLLDAQALKLVFMMAL